jgi:hypothetical protein
MSDAESAKKDTQINHFKGDKYECF